MYFNCWIGAQEQEEEFSPWCISVRIGTHWEAWCLPPCLQLVHSTGSVGFFVPIDRASSCLFTILASAMVSLGAHEVILPHSGNVCWASQWPMVLFCLTLSYIRIFCCSPSIRRHEILSGNPSSFCLDIHHIVFVARSFWITRSLGGKQGCNTFRWFFPLVWNGIPPYQLAFAV